MVENCDSCRFSKRTIIIFCRRYPPVFGPNHDRHAEVGGAMWCGEYKEAVTYVVRKESK